MGKVTGIGGLFFRAQDPKALGAWYEKHFAINSMGGTEVWKQQEGPTVFTPFKADTKYFGENQQFMVNFRVEGMEEFLEKLESEGVTVERHDDVSYGKFAWVYDPEGNKIELWEPAS